jgi:hypothetical protein
VLSNQPPHTTHIFSLTLPLSDESVFIYYLLVE